MGEQVAINPRQRNQSDRDCRQNDQRWPQHAMILRARYQELQWFRRLCSLGLPYQVWETPLQMRGDKPRIGPQDVKIPGRLDTEVPAIHRAKYLHGFRLKLRAGLRSQPPPLPPQISGRIIGLTPRCSLSGKARSRLRAGYQSSIDSSGAPTRTLKHVNIELDYEQRARLELISIHTGKPPAQVLIDAAQSLFNHEFGCSSAPTQAPILSEAALESRFSRLLGRR
jgi:hypothetical protein